MNLNQIFHNSNDLNISNSSEKELNDILTEDLLSYSEDKSQSLANFKQVLENNKNIMNNHNLQKNINNYKNETNYQLNKSEITISILSGKNQNQNQKNTSKSNNVNEEKENKKSNNDDKDLSVLQISLSNLLSDIDSKDIFLNQYNKINEINNENNNNFDKINNKNNNPYNNNNSNENNNLTNKNQNIINSKDKITPNEEYSSVCNYSQSISNNNNNNKINNTNNNLIKNKDNNLDNIKNNINDNIINSNFSNTNNEKNPINLFKNIKSKHLHRKNIFRDKLKNILPNNQNKFFNKKIKEEFEINNKENIKVMSSTKTSYQIERCENIQISVNGNSSNNKEKKSNENRIYNSYNNKGNLLLSINKTHNFTIDNSNSDYNNNIIEFCDLLKKRNIKSMEIIKELLKNNEILNENLSKNKIKLINNKNIETTQDESKKFFYNPKIKNNINNLFYNNKNNLINKIIKTDNNNLSSINNTNENNPTDRNVKKDKKLILKKYNFKKISSNNPNLKTKNFSQVNNNNKPRNSTSFNKNITNNKIKYPQKIYLVKNKRKNSSNSGYYNISNEKDKRKITKMKNNKRSIEITDINYKKKFNIVSNNNNNNSNKLKEKNVFRRYECSTEPTKKIFKKNYKKNNHSATNDLFKKIKSCKKENTNKLLNKFTNINNININIINKGTLFPIISKIFKESTNNKIIKENISDNNKKKIKKLSTNIIMGSFSSNNKKKIKINNKIVKINKNICLTDNIFYKKEKKNDINQHKKINTQINLTSLLNSFNTRDKNNRKNNQSLFNFGNIFFINQSHILKKKDSETISTHINEKSNLGINKEKTLFLSDNLDNSKMNTLNYSIIKQKPQVINDFSNYKKKGNNNHKINEKKNDSINVRNSIPEYKMKRAITDINDNFKNNFNIKIKFRDTLKLRKHEGDHGKDIIKG